MVIIEGTVVAVSDTATRTRFDRAYLIKYDLDPSTRVDPDSMVYKIEPRTIMAWIEKDFPSTATRWRFG